MIFHKNQGDTFTIIPWHTSASSCEQWPHICPCQSCTCELFLALEDHQGLGPSAGNRWTARPVQSLLNLRQMSQNFEDATHKFYEYKVALNPEHSLDHFFYSSFSTIHHSNNKSITFIVNKSTYQTQELCQC